MVVIGVDTVVTLVDVVCYYRQDGHLVNLDSYLYQRSWSSTAG